MLQQDNMPVDDAPEDDGDDAPRQSYNFAPGYHGIVYRADTPDWGAGPHRHAKKAGDDTEAVDEAADQSSSTLPSGSGGGGSDDSDASEVRYKLQSMKWGLIPFWTKRNPDYGSMMKTINCRDDSLAQGGGMWNTMKARKRCIVVAQGFYEWLKKDGGREKIPHFVKRRDGALMCFAGLWDCVQYEGTYPSIVYLWIGAGLIRKILMMTQMTRRSTTHTLSSRQTQTSSSSSSMNECPSF